MPSESWVKSWIYLSIILSGVAKSARPRFDTSTDMSSVLVPADAEVDSVIFRLRATDQDADFPLVFDIVATVTPIVRIENLPCTHYNKVCQANVILTRYLTAGRLHDFAVRVRDSKGDTNSMQATIAVTNATTPRDKIFPHIPALIMVPENAKPGTELDYILVQSHVRSSKPVYIELWQGKELFTIRQRQTATHTKGIITLIGELDFETQSMYTLTMYATDPYTDRNTDTRNIAGLNLVVIVQDVQDVPPIFTIAPPLTKINNTVKPGDVILRVHAEDGDKGVPREVTYGLVSENNPFTPFFNISEFTGEIVLARTLEELTQITHVGAPVVLTVVAEEIRRSTQEPPAQATVVKVGLLLGEPGNSPPYFENDNYVTSIDENAEPGSSIIFSEPYITQVRDEDIGKAGVFALKLENNNGTFEISPAVAERTANFILTVRDNALIDYEMYKSLRFKIIAQEVGPATNLSATVPVTIYLRDKNDNPPEFQEKSYEITLSENATPGTRVTQVHATDKDTGIFGIILYSGITGPGSEAFVIDADTGIITVAMEMTILNRELSPQLQLTVEARDENGKGLRGTVPLIINLLDVNDNAPIFEKDTYEFTLNENFTNFTIPAVIKAFDADAESPNNVIRYEIINGNYENKFYLDNVTGELFLREQVMKIRNTRQNPYQRFATKFKNTFARVHTTSSTFKSHNITSSTTSSIDNTNFSNRTGRSIRSKRENKDLLFTLTARAYDLGVPLLSGTTQVRILQNPLAAARIVMFVVPGEHPDPKKTAQTLETITGGRITVQEIRPYTAENLPNNSGSIIPTPGAEKRSIVVAQVERTGSGASLVDFEKIRTALAANGFGVIAGDMTDGGTTTNTNNTITTVNSEEVTVYRAENKLLTWLLALLGLLILALIITLIVCCICPTCPFYMSPRKRRVHSSETLVAQEGRPKRHLHRRHPHMMGATWSEMKQAWSADPARSNWQFNRRNTKNFGIASLPGDITHIVERELPPKASSLHLRDGPVYIMEPDQRHGRPYMEDTMDPRGRSYTNLRDMNSHRGRDIERASDLARQYRSDARESDRRSLREQHYYRDGNTEVMRLVTRGVAEETTATMHQQPEIVIDAASVHRDGKDILLRRFIEDQNLRIVGEDYHGSMQDLEQHSMESHQRQKEALQQEILLLPENLQQDRRHIEEVGPDVQRLIIDHGTYEKSDVQGSQDILSGATLIIHGPMNGEKPKEQKSSVNLQHYSLHDLELARQNALLTRLLLERDRGVGGGVMDTGSYLETQSLPGQVAAGTQTNHTAATQTEQYSRSRSDNDESEEDAKMRRKLRSKKRYGDEPKRIRTLWMRSPIREEDHQYSEKSTNVLRKKMRDIKDGRKISIEPEVLKEISDSLDETADSPLTVRQRFVDSSRYESRDDEILRREDSSSVEMFKDYSRRSRERSRERISKKETVPEPSFRILEREMSTLNKKLTKLAEAQRAESEEDRGVNEDLPTDPTEDNQADEYLEETKSAKHEIIKGKRVKSIRTQSTSKEQTKISDSSEKSQLRSKYRRKLPISTASSEFEEISEKPKKPSANEIPVSKSKSIVRKSGHPKLKRQIAVVDLRETEIPTKSRAVITGKRKEITLKRLMKVENKSTKSETESDQTRKETVAPDRRKMLVKLMGRSDLRDSDRDDRRSTEESSSKQSGVKKKSKHTDDSGKSDQKTLSDHLETSFDITKSSTKKSPSKSMKSTTDTGSMGSGKRSTSSSMKPSVETSPEFVKAKIKKDMVDKIDETSNQSERSRKSPIKSTEEVHITAEPVVEQSQKTASNGNIESTDSIETVTSNSPSPVKLSKKIEDDTQRAVLKTIERTKSIIGDAKNVAKRVVEDVNTKVIDSFRELIGSHQTTPKIEETSKEEHETVKSFTASPLGSDKESDVPITMKVKSAETTNISSIPIESSGEIESMPSPKLEKIPIDSDKIEAISPVSTSVEHSEALPLPQSSVSNVRESEIDTKTNKPMNILREIIAPLIINVSEPKTPEPQIVDVPEDEKLEPTSEQLSPVSQTSSLSPKRVVISRETSFLSSPKRLPSPETSQSTMQDLEVSSMPIEPDDKLIMEIGLSPENEISIEKLPEKSEIEIQTSKLPATAVSAEHPEPSLDVLEDDSDVSSESSTQTAFIARPYGTPRHRRLVRMENIETDEGLKASDGESDVKPTETNDIMKSPIKEHLENLTKNDSKEDITGGEVMKEIVTDETSSLLSVNETEQLDHIDAGKQLEAAVEEPHSSTDPEIGKIKPEIFLDDKTESIEASQTCEDQIQATEASVSSIDDAKASETSEIGASVSIEGGSIDDSMLAQSIDQGILMDHVVEVVKGQIDIIQSEDLPLNEPEQAEELQVKSLEMPEAAVTMGKTEEDREKVELITKPDKDRLADVDGSTSLTDQSESLEKGATNVPALSAMIHDQTELTSSKIMVYPDESEQAKVMESSKEQPVTSKSPDTSRERSKIAGKKPPLKTLAKALPRLRKQENQNSKEKTELVNEASRLRIVPKKDKVAELNLGQSESDSNERARPRKRLERTKNQVYRSKMSTSRPSKEREHDKDHKHTGNHYNLAKNANDTRNRISKSDTRKKSSSSSDRSKKNGSLKKSSEDIKIDKPVTLNIEETGVKHVKQSIVEQKSDENAFIESTSLTSEDVSVIHSIPNQDIPVRTEEIPEESKQPSDSFPTQLLSVEEQLRCTSQSSSRERNSIDRERSPSPRKTIKHYKDEHIEAQSRYMAWYKQNREETERRRQEKMKEGEDEESPPKWLRKSTRQRWLKMSPEDRKIFENLRTPEVTPPRRRKIKPLVNIESEQLKAIVRQGRQLRRAEGQTDDVPVEIYAPEKPPTPPPPPTQSHKYYLIQHSEYKYEKIPPPFYLHPPPVPNPTPQPSPQPCEVPECHAPSEEEIETEILVSLQSGRLRHQQLLEKKSVFDIAYSEAAPSHLRADSTTPPS